MAREGIISLVRSMLDEGASVEEVVLSLKEMGFSEEEAKRIIVLANRDLLLVLRNDLREIARSVVREELEKALKDVREEVKRSIESSATIINRRLFKYLKDEINKYIKELSELEEKVDVIDKRTIRLENDLYREGSRNKGTAGMLRPGLALGILGALAGIAAWIFLKDPLIKISVGIFSILLMVGGVVIESLR